MKKEDRARWPEADPAPPPAAGEEWPPVSEAEGEATAADGGGRADQVGEVMSWAGGGDDSHPSTLEWAER